MKNSFILILLAFMSLSVACQREGDVIEREEEMNRGDLVEDSYKQSDIHPGGKPSNVGNQ